MVHIWSDLSQKYLTFRQQCLSDSQCEFYVWKGFSSGKTCHLKSSSLWLPTYESGTVSGKKQRPNFSVNQTFAVKILVMFSYKILNIKL